ncbi:MAG: hypothetical protein PHE93_03695 [Clostridia bacterium]|nr:hypothetical protein [Clostridia bacterium]
MFTTILSATMNYADYALLGLAGLLFLVCLTRGFGKSLYGFFFSLVIILGSFYISGIATEPILKTSAGQQFNTAIDGWSESWGPAFNNEIYFSNGTAVIYPAGNSGGAVTLSDSLGGNMVVGLLVDRIVPKVIPAEGGMSLSDVIVPNITYIGGYLIIFIGALILIKIIFKIISSLWDKFTHDGQTHKAIDKIMGALISIVYSGAFALFILSIVGMLADKPFLGSVVEMVQNSQYCSWIFVNNPILTIFMRLFVA